MCDKIQINDLLKENEALKSELVSLKKYKKRIRKALLVILILQIIVKIFYL